MKCNTCKAIISSSSNHCEFCGEKITKSVKSTDNDNSSVNPKIQSNKSSISFSEDAMNLVRELRETDSQGFNWWAFFFPVAFLSGHGNKDNAKKIAIVVLIPVLVLSIIKYLVPSLFSLLNILTIVWTIYVYYLVATRYSKMTKESLNFDLPTALVYQFLFIVIYLVIENL